MVQSFRFAIVRLAPGGARDERINVGVVVFGEDMIDVRLPRRLDKIRVLSAAVDQTSVRELTEAISSRDEVIRMSGISDVDARRRAIGRVGPLELSQIGAFTAADQTEYENRITSIMRQMVEPEPARLKVQEKRSRLLTQLKRALREERVLARKFEDLSSHRFVQNLPLAEGLVADLVLKNGAMHVIETVDASTDAISPRKAVSDIAVSALVIEQARINYGDRQTKGRLVYEASSFVEKAAQSCLEAAAHQGAELINWASQSDRIKLITTIASLAIPSETRADQAKRFVGSDMPKLRLA